MSIPRIARQLFSLLAAVAMTTSLAAHAQANVVEVETKDVAAERAHVGADKIAAKAKFCKGFLHPETGSWFSEQVRAGDLHASLIANKTYTVGTAYPVQVWSGGKWNASYAIVHNFDNDGVCEVRAAVIP